MIRATDIHSLTEFTRNARTYIQQIKGNKMPLAITVNGVAQVVVQDAETYQRMVDELERSRIAVTLNGGSSNAGLTQPDLNQPFSMVRGTSNSE
jgi:PHD/YefM family antitoxin component YafN of YafNO toxin-antitoxin module